MKILTISLFTLVIATAARAEGEAPVASTAKTGVPVETVKVTDQADQGLFERVRDTYIRAEKKGLLASAAAASTPR